MEPIAILHILQVLMLGFFFSPQSLRLSILSIIFAMLPLSLVTSLAFASLVVGSTHSLSGRANTTAEVGLLSIGKLSIFHQSQRLF